MLRLITRLIIRRWIRVDVESRQRIAPLPNVLCLLDFFGAFGQPWLSVIGEVAEGGGFEPPVGFDTPRQFSKLLV